MVGSLALAAGSLAIRALRPSARPLAIAMSLASYAGVSAGAYVGGDVVYGLGNMVDRHAWTSFGRKWRSLDVSEVPDGELVLGHAGDTPLVVYRDGTTIRALHDTCAHAGGPLHEGKLVDGCVECPWHGSRFGLADGRVRRGPAVYDQPVFEVRESEAGGFEVRRRIEA
jgi:nitrite reductase/ring-hydroxylating ferredoxin subunit